MHKVDEIAVATSRQWRPMPQNSRWQVVRSTLQSNEATRGRGGSKKLTVTRENIVCLQQTVCRQQEAAHRHEWPPSGATESTPLPKQFDRAAE